MPSSYDNLYFVYLMSQVKFIVCKYLISRKTPKKLKVNSTKYNSLNSLKIKMKYKAFTKEKTKKTIIYQGITLVCGTIPLLDTLHPFSGQ